MKVEDREGMVVSTAGQGGNRGGVESQVRRVAAKPTVMLATGIRCCGPQALFSSSSHKRHIQGAAEALRSGGETACLQGCHDKVQERPGRGEEGIEVKRGGQQSERHKPDYRVIRDGSGNASTLF
ncbi:hypothetical protein D9C73_016028 [Collichthys lucidus]|uniref:Uncharacterized protein n=1 Tax=Collichthys lucidus TaxID=240159 RepID=A0A4U5V3V8_COLLU|nr:hypothetical protein D9C73_016028 [Collichthys lucidus]